MATLEKYICFNIKESWAFYVATSHSFTSIYGNNFHFRYATLFLSIKGRSKYILSLLDQNIYGKGFHFSTEGKFVPSYWKKELRF